MIRRTVILSPEARIDLLHLYDWIAEAAAPATALRFIERVETYLYGFDVASERGTRRDDVRPGLRTIGYARRLTIAFTVDPDRITILRIFYGGAGLGSGAGRGLSRIERTARVAVTPSDAPFKSGLRPLTASGLERRIGRGCWLPSGSTPWKAAIPPFQGDNACSMHQHTSDRSNVDTRRCNH